MAFENGAFIKRAGESNPLKSNYTATSNPGVTNDSAEGYSVGSVWINTSTDAWFACTDNTVGAAVWVSTAAGGGVTSVNGDVGPVVTLDGSEVDSTYTPSNYTATSVDIDGNLEGIDNKLGTITNPLLFKGAIAAAADFPTPADVQNGWFYRITADVTDNDVTKTNTGQSFLDGDEIAWNGSDWTEIGSVDLWNKVGTDLVPATTGDNVKIQNDDPTILLDGTVGDPGGTVSLILDIDADGGGDGLIQFKNDNAVIGNIGGVGSLNFTTAAGIDIDITAAADLNLDDQYLSAPITLSEAGTTALVGFTATSVVGALNEVKSEITAESLWDRSGTDLRPENDGDTVSLFEGSPDARAGSAILGVYGNDPTLTVDGAAAGNPGGTTTLSLNGDLATGGGDVIISFEDYGTTVGSFEMSDSGMILSAKGGRTIEITNNAATDVNTGTITVSSGTALGTGNTGITSLKSGIASGTGDSGNVEISTGGASSGTTGDITLQTGTGVTDGKIKLLSETISESTTISIFEGAEDARAGSGTFGVYGDNPVLLVDGAAAGDPGGDTSVIINADVDGGGEGKLIFQGDGVAAATLGFASDLAIASTTNLTFNDQYLSAAIPISETGTTGLSGFTATSIVGALNELQTEKLDKTLSVEAFTANDTLTSDESGKVCTNEGAAGAIELTLPTAAAGITYTFYVQAAQYLRINAGASDTIRNAGTASAAAGYFRANTVGNLIRITAINATEWVTETVVGTWNVDA